jgi:hypothetical protein
MPLPAEIAAAPRCSPGRSAGALYGRSTRLPGGMRLIGLAVVSWSALRLNRIRLRRNRRRRVYTCEPLPKHHRFVVRGRA